MSCIDVNHLSLCLGFFRAIFGFVFVVFFVFMLIFIIKFIRYFINMGNYNKKSGGDTDRRVLLSGAPMSAYFLISTYITLFFSFIFCVFLFI